MAALSFVCLAVPGGACTSQVWQMAPYNAEAAAGCHCCCRQAGAGPPGWAAAGIKAESPSHSVKQQTTDGMREKWAGPPAAEHPRAETL
ncbi:Hypothetical predicted protein, partial [Olea europaea subsp. europaea]